MLDASPVCLSQDFSQFIAGGAHHFSEAGMVAATGFVLISYVTKEFALRHKSEFSHNFLNRIKHRDLRLLVISVGAVAGLAFETLLVAGVLSHAVVAGIMVLGWRGNSASAETPE